MATLYVTSSVRLGTWLYRIDRYHRYHRVQRDIDVDIHNKRAVGLWLRDAGYLVEKRVTYKLTPTTITVLDSNTGLPLFQLRK